MSTPRGAGSLSGDTEILHQDRPPLAPIMDGASRPQPDEREDAAGWRKIDAGQSRSKGWASIDDAEGANGEGWRQV